MLLMNSPPPAVEVLALLSTPASRCEILKLTSGEEAGDPIEARCGANKTLLGRALKGVSVNRIRACQIVLNLNAVNSPRLISLENCRGFLSVTDIGKDWTMRLQRLAAIKNESVEFVTYERIPKKRECYKVTVTFDSKLNSQNTEFKEKTGRFCVPIR